MRHSLEKGAGCPFAAAEPVVVIHLAYSAHLFSRPLAVLCFLLCSFFVAWIFVGLVKSLGTHHYLLHAFALAQEHLVASQNVFSPHSSGQVLESVDGPLLRVGSQEVVEAQLKRVGV